MRGRFITLEGLEGAGKSSLLPHLEDYLREQEIDLTVTREPGGTALGEKVRELLLDPASEVTPVAELCLVFAARAQHVATVIEPALSQGRWVLCDRFTEASYAYQGGGRRLGEDKVAVLEKLVQGSLRPDLTILLDLDPTIGLGRTRGRSFQDRFEVEQADFFERARVAYQKLSERHPERIVVVNAELDQQTVLQAVKAALEERMAAWT